MNRLKQIRECAGISQEKLSLITTIHTRTINRHEGNREINRELLTLYADAFQLPMEFINGTPNDLTGRFDRELAMLALPELFKSRFAAFNCEVLDPHKQYYLIWEKHALGNIEQGFHSVWVMDTSDEQVGCIKGKRIPRLMSNPNREYLEKSYGKLMVINSSEGAIALQFLGGAALIEKEICEQYFPELFTSGFLAEGNVPCC